jgi:hypothetical protein
VVDVEHVQYTSSRIRTDHPWSHGLRPCRPPRICVHGDVRTVRGRAVLNLGGKQHPVVAYVHHVPGNHRDAASVDG